MKTVQAQGNHCIFRFNLAGVINRTATGKGSMQENRHAMFANPALPLDFYQRGGARPTARKECG